MAAVSGTSGNDFIHVAGDGEVVPGGYNDLPDATNGNDNINAGGGDDIIYSGSGNDNIVGGAGNDTIIFSNGSQLTGADAIDGGGGNDTLIVQTNSINGGARTTLNIVGIDTLMMEGNGNDLMTLADTAVAAGRTLTLDTTLQVTSAAFTFLDGTLETDGHFKIIAGVGETEVDGGALSDTFINPNGGFLVAQGRGGDDTLTVAGAHGTWSFDGGAGFDTLILDGDHSIKTVLNTSANIIENVEMLHLDDGFSYRFSASDSILSAGQTMTVDASRLTGSNVLLWDASPETNGTYTVLGGQGNDVLTGGALDDTLNGGRGNDSFDLGKGGDDTVIGGAGNDQITAGAAFTAGDSIDGGNGTDNLILAGDYSAGVTMTATTLVGVEFMTLSAGSSYSFTTNDATVAANRTMTVDATALGAANHVVFDGSAETDGHLILLGGVGADTLIGGSDNDAIAGNSGNDVIDISAGGNDRALGNDGNDTINAGGAFTAADEVDGGSGTDTLNFDGNYASGVMTLNGGSISNIETLHFAAGNSYAFKSNDGNLTAGHTMKVDGSALGAGDSLFFNASGETDGRLVMLGGAGDDRLLGGDGNDVFTGGLGADALAGEGGRNVFNYASVAESTSATFDTLAAFNVDGTDTIHLPFIPGAIDTAVTTGALSRATFDANLASAIGAGQLGVGDAVVFTPDSGDLATHHFLIIDANGAAGYQAGQDYVIQLGNGSDLAITTATFT